MATGPTDGCSKAGGSDQDQTFLCSECFKSGTKQEASHYCQTCDRCYCKPCLCDHDVLGKSKMQQWGQSTKRKTEDMCARHPTEALLMYCKDHDDLCCQVCLSTKHGACTRTMDLQLIKDERPSEDEIDVITEMLSRIRKKAESLKDRKPRNDSLDTSYDASLSRLKEFRKTVNSVFDDMELELSQQKNSCRERSKYDENVCDNAVATSGMLEGQLGKDREHMTSYELKKCKQWVTYTEEHLSEMNEYIVRDSFLSIPMSEIENAAKMITNLGAIHSVLSFSTAFEGDEHACCVVGMCQMPDGSVVVADGANKKLKAFDCAYKAAGQLKLDQKPTDVCYVNGTEVVVSLEKDPSFQGSFGLSFSSHREMILIGFIKNKFVTSRRVPLKMYVNKLAALNGILCGSDLSCGASLHIFRTNCDFVKTVSNQRQVEMQTMAANQKTGEIYITLQERGEILIFKQNESFETIRIPVKTHPVGICFDDEGLLCISDNDNNEVKKLKLIDGRYTVVRTHVVPEKPGLLCFDRYHRKILVASLESNTVFAV